MSGEEKNKPKITRWNSPYWGFAPSTESMKKQVERSLDRRRVIEFEKKLREKYPDSDVPDMVKNIREDITYV